MQYMKIRKNRRQEKEKGVGHPVEPGIQESLASSRAWQEAHAHVWHTDFASHFVDTGVKSAT